LLGLSTCFNSLETILQPPAIITAVLNAYIPIPTLSWGWTPYIPQKSLFTLINIKSIVLHWFWSLFQWGKMDPSMPSALPVVLKSTHDHNIQYIIYLYVVGITMRKVYDCLKQPSRVHTQGHVRVRVQWGIFPGAPHHVEIMEHPHIN